MAAIYSKYNVVTTTKYKNPTGFKYVGQQEVWQQAGAYDGYKNYSFSESTGFSVNGNPGPYDMRSGDKSKVYRYDYSGTNGAWMVYNMYLNEATKVDEKSQGTLVQSNIIAPYGTYPDNGAHSDGYWYVYQGEDNKAPSVTLSTANSKTLYENDTLILNGQVSDGDNGQAVNIRYQLNNEPHRALGTGISNGTTPITFNKTLTFKLGKLYDGNTVVSNALADGVNHTVKVWAEDEKGAKSAEHVRTFQVVANRAPVLTVNPVTTQSGLINFDKLTISGTATDPEGQNLKVKYNVNGGTFTEVHNGQGGSFSFQLPLSQLQTGQNTVIIQAVDSYDYIASKTLNISKTHNLTALLHGVARYKLATPEAGISELVTWVERTIGDLDISMAASMVTTGQAESFADMTYSNTAPIDDGIEEDEFTLTTTGAKTDVSLKLELSRASVTSNEMVNRITGTFN